MPSGAAGPTDREALAWTPMRPFPGRRHVAVRDPILEPFWSGLRVIAHVSPAGAGERGAHVRMVEAGGADLAPDLHTLAADVAQSLGGAEAVVDGIITRQVALEGIGVAAIPEVRMSASRLLLGSSAELDILPRRRTRDVRASAAGGVAGDERETEAEGLVAVDLLRLDGTVLLDVPLLERKRLLESVLSQTQLVRVSVHTRPPYEPWVATWKALGLRGGILKGANSRYQPGTRCLEWRVVEGMGRGR